MSHLPRIRRVALWMIVSAPIAFAVAYLALPSERTLLVTGLDGSAIEAMQTNPVGIERVDRSVPGRLDRIQDPLSRVRRLGPDETLWRLPPRSWAAGLGFGDDLDAWGFVPGDGFTFERRPHRWADPVFVALLLSGGLFGLLRTPGRPATPPAR